MKIIVNNDNIYSARPFRKGLNASFTKCQSRH
jgi:hypothetical protein